MRFNTRLALCTIAPAILFVTALATSLWGLVRTQDEFDRYIGTEQAIAAGLTDMYAQGLQTGQALRNIVLDPANRKAYDNLEAAQQAYDKAAKATADAAQGTAFAAGLAELQPLRAAHAQRQAKVLEAVKSDPSAAAKVLTAEETPAWRDLRARLMQSIDASRKLAQQVHSDTRSRARGMTLVAVSLAALALGAAVLLCVLMRRTVRQELGADPADAREALRHIADGDLSARDRADVPPTSLMGELQRTRQQLERLVAQVRSSTDSIRTASAEIATGNIDLSQRTEQTAGSLQQTASSMEQLNGTVCQSADAAQQAHQLADTAASVAQRGGEVVGQVVATMSDIHQSSQKIADIISTIDGIAFQTNILALNAAVEAARAGEQGRGFAVVAGEVRSLAQRSAEAAKQIKSLIGASVEKVESGSRLVQNAGSTMDEIVASVQRVSRIVGEISSSAVEQRDGIGQVNGAVTQLDQMTQQNAALVEESAAAAESLKDQAQRLAQVVATFRLHTA